MSNERAIPDTYRIVAMMRALTVHEHLTQGGIIRPGEFVLWKDNPEGFDGVVDSVSTLEENNVIRVVWWNRQQPSPQMIKNSVYMNSQADKLLYVGRIPKEELSHG